MPPCGRCAYSWQALAAEVVSLEEAALAVRCRELRAEADLARALESHSHMQSQLGSLARDRAALAAGLHALQAR